MEIRHLRTQLGIAITLVHFPIPSHRSTTLSIHAEVMEPIEDFLLDPSQSDASKVQRASPYSHITTVLHENAPVFDNTRSRSTNLFIRKLYK